MYDFDLVNLGCGVYGLKRFEKTSEFGRRVAGKSV
jgi:hypothetical protein